ncbi:MAG: dihydroxy-acid dehydratase, partial [Actinomycetota bacterium]|nr:dihydroxy-acid dehydratase [Actinomycetota bacterium]
WRSHDVTIQDVFEAVGQYDVGRLSEAELHDLEGAACPGPGACGGQFTANTMATAMDVLGLSPIGLSEIPATDPAKHDAARRAGEMAVTLLRQDVTPARSSRGPPWRTRSRVLQPPADRPTPPCT